jgi:hypothetical protein
MRECPTCRLLNRDVAQRCDCGYDFCSGKQAYLSQPLPRYARYWLIFVIALSILTSVNACVSGAPFPIVISALWTGMIGALYRALVRRSNGARIALAILTFPIGTFILLTPKVRLYCRQEKVGIVIDERHKERVLQEGKRLFGSRRSFFSNRPL